MKVPVKQAIKQKFSEHKLSAEQLQALQGRFDEKVIPTPSKPVLTYYVAITAIITTLLLSILVVYAPSKSEDLPQLIAAEVVRNHLKLKPLEITTSSIQKIRSYFDKLNFQPIASANITGDSVLMGGRYCSLQGYTAAQLRMHNKTSGQLDTVYQAPYLPDVYGVIPDINRKQKPLTVYKRGIKVTIWVENDILFARTHVE